MAITNKMKIVENQEAIMNKQQKSSVFFDDNTVQDYIYSFIGNCKNTSSRNLHTPKVASRSLQPAIICHLSNFGSSNNRKNITRHTSLIGIMTSNKIKLHLKSKTKSCNGFRMKYRNVIISPAFRHKKQTNFNIYRCQITQDDAPNCDNCCCSCNSDTLFEVMKDLYECYKKKNCDKCNCILCCHLPKEERFAQLRKPKVTVDLETALREIAKKGFLLPEAKTLSEKQLLDKIRLDLGLPPEPKTQSMKEKYTNGVKAGIMLPLEDKSAKQKEKILQGLNDMGIPLPEGRTASEKSLINKIQTKNMPPMEASTTDPRENLLKELAMQGVFLPEAKTLSLKNLIDKVRVDLGLPPEPKTLAMKIKYKDAVCDGIFLPLEGKTATEKENILQRLHERGIPLPQGRTHSEKVLIDKIKAKHVVISKSKVDKSPSQLKNIIGELTKRGILPPEEMTSSKSALIAKLRKDVGLPPEPKTSSMRHKYVEAAEAGLIQPLEGKSPKEKSNILNTLKKMGLPLPKGRTPSEEGLIKQIKTQSVTSLITKLSERQRSAKTAGLLTPLKGKTPSQKEKILTGLAKQDILLPEGTISSDKSLINKIPYNLGLPPEPKSPSMKEKYSKAAAAGLLQTLEGKTPKEKTKMLKALQNMGIPLPKARTPSEKVLIEQIKARTLKPSVAEVTPLEGKSTKEKILREQAKRGLLLREGKTASEKSLLKKIRRDLGLPPEPKTSSMRNKHKQAADVGLLNPLKGKSLKEKERILRGLHNLGISLPEGQTPSEKAFIINIKEKPKVPLILSPSEKMRRAKASGLLTPLEGKTPSQKEKILTGLVRLGIPLPEGKTPSNKNLMMKIRNDLGLPPEPKSASMKEKYAKAADAGLLQALEGKLPKDKSNILVNLQNMGIPLPKGRTPSEKALIQQIKTRLIVPSVSRLSEKMRRAKAAGLLTPLEGKSPAQKEKIVTELAKLGIPLPEGKTPSERNLIINIGNNLGLPPVPKSGSMKEKYAKAANAGLLQPLEGKSQNQKKNILINLQNMGIPLPEGRTPSEKALIKQIQTRVPSVRALTEKMRRAKSAGLLTPLEGKSPAQKEKILTIMAKRGITLPEAKTPSEKNLFKKIRRDLGLPPEPKTASMRHKHQQAADVGLLCPLKGNCPKEKERILRGLHNLGIPLPEAQTPSEKALIDKIKEEPRSPSTISFLERKRRAKAAGLLTPLEGKTPAEKEKILTGLARLGIPMPEGTSPSDKRIIINIGNNLGLPPAPRSASLKKKYARAAEAGLLKPLEGKSYQEKNNILINLQNMGIPLPEGRTSSEKNLIQQIKARSRAPSVASLSEKIRRAKIAGQLTPLEGKTPSQKVKILTELAKQGIPLPPGKTPSEQNIIINIGNNLGLPPTPKSASMREKYAKAAEAGFLQPLKGKSANEKKYILINLQNMGIPLPEGRTPSEKALILQIKTRSRTTSAEKLSEKLNRAKATGLLTPLKGKTPSQKEKILVRLIKHGFPLPEGKTPSEKSLINKLLSRSPESKSRTMKEKYSKAAVLPLLEGKFPKEKTNILYDLHNMGLPLPEGRTPSEKALVSKIKATPQTRSIKSPKEIQKVLRNLANAGFSLPEGKTPSQKAMIKQINEDFGVPKGTPGDIRKPRMIPKRTHSQKIAVAKSAGLLTPLEGKSEAKIEKIKTRSLESRFDKLSPREKERFLRKQLISGKSMPEVKTPSTAKLLKKIIDDMGLPPEPKTPSLKEKNKKARLAGLITPLEGKSSEQKEKILKSLVDAGIPLPKGRTLSEKAMINKFRAQKPLEGLSPDQKETTLKRLATQHLPLPEGTSASEKILIAKVRKDLGLPPEPETASMKERMLKAQTAGFITPLEGKTPAQKEQYLKGLIDSGIPLPEGRTPSEKVVISKIKALKPLEGKSRKERAEVMKKLAAHGLPLPEGVTPSEEKIIEKESGKCSRACGCDKKKIKFKHSYVKIKVTSPDVSNLCVCPEECIPRVKGGVFLDDVINVVIESAIGAPHYCIEQKTTKLTSGAHGIHDNVKPNYTLKKDLSQNIEIIFENNNKPAKFYSKFEVVKNLPNRSLKNLINMSSLLRDENTSNTESYYKPVKKYTKRSTNKRRASVTEITNSIYKVCDISNCITTDSSRDSIASIFYIESESSLGLSSTSSECNMYSSSSSISERIALAKNSDLESSLRYIYTSDMTLDNISMSSDSNVFTNSPKINSIKISNTHHENIFKVFQTEVNNMHEMNCTDKNNSQTGDTVIVINDVNSEFDIASLVNNLLSNEEFDDVSSLFVVVTTSDDENDEITLNNLNSATCNQLRKNYDKRKFSKELIFTLPYERKTSNTSGLKVSAKGKRFLLEGAPTCAVKEYAVLKENTTIDKQNEFNYCPPRNVTSTKNKRCQIITPDIVINNSTHVVSTDTTQDRPCCCPMPGKGSVTDLSSVQAHWSAEFLPIYRKAPHVTNVISELITPAFSGRDSSTCCSLNMCCSAKSSSPTIASASPSYPPCGIRPICSGHSGCTIPSNILHGVAGGPRLPEPLAELKRLLEKPCKCTPKQMAKIFQEVLAKSQKSTRDTGTCGPPSPMAHPPSELADGPASADTSEAPCRMELKKTIVVLKNASCGSQSAPRPTCTSELQSCCNNQPKGCPSCDGQPKVRSCCDSPPKPCPFFASQTDPLPAPTCPTERECLKKCITLKKTKQKSKAKSKSKKKSHSVQVKCSDSCLYQNPYVPSIGQATPSPFNEPGFTESISIQIGPGCVVCPSGLPCSSPHTTCPKTTIKAKKLLPPKIIHGKSSQTKLNREIVQIEIVGPLGGLSEIGSNGKLTQAGIIQIRRNNEAYAGEQLVGPLPPPIKEKGKKTASAPKRKKNKVICKCPPWEPEPEDLSPINYDQLRRNIVIMKSDLTQTVSGFKVLKPKAPPERHWGVEDSIKYYASVNPKFISELVPPRIVVRPHKSDCACYDPKYNSAGSEWPDWPGVGTVSEPPREEPFTGFKIRVDGKGSGSKGLQGICCFDMIQDG